MSDTVIHVSEFTETPGPRYMKDGESSGEEFRKEVVLPAFRKALEEGSVLTIDLNDTFGYASCFLDEVFGGLAREFGSRKVREHLRIVTDQQALDYEVRHYIEKPNLVGWATRDNTGFWTSVTWDRVSAEVTARDKDNGDGYVYPIYSGPGERIER